ncbi:hypothetical protein HYH02_013130 [Chlamydomonas schloesseri]|uniref:Bacterial repeat domain-containing protein n=1 Tax=Chlamydomonas schloesseri TaxID=2026947 RepID=A0A835SV25_9CHLO|nr:hypothetical protein HYH02_013130 [Chlamydomonas schloesseri]|eukprot:KAG2432062.1 hypothetical protein HYH02_013130 [Chlamydomonas schloesseri]
MALLAALGRCILALMVIQDLRIGVAASGRGLRATNTPPQVNMTSILTPLTLTAPVSRYYIGVSASDPGGWVVNVTVFANGVPCPGSTIYGVLFSTNTTGTYVFTATAVDNLGATTTSAPSATLTIVAPSPYSGGGGGTSGGSTGTISTMVNVTVIGGSGSGVYNPYTYHVITAADPPAGQVFDRWVSSSGYPQLGDAYHYNTTVFSASTAPITLTATYKVDTPVPCPVCTHPRLLVTVDDLPALRARANAANPMHLQGFAPALQQALAHANQAWSWSFAGGSGTPNLAVWRDTGSDSWEGDHTEAYGEILAFAGLIYNDISYARRARDMLMWVINTAAANMATGNASLPFASPWFATFNRASHYMEGLPLMFDWLQAWPGLITPADKAAVRAVFMKWCEDNLAGYMAPQPIRVINSPLLLANKGFRNIANNYASAHGRNLAYMALSIDPADDPVKDPKLGESYIGNTLRSYVYDVTGAWLYQKFACMEAPARVAAVLPGVAATTPGLGECMHGGNEPEGFLYGTSIAYVHETLQALHTSGWATPALAGPQIALLNSSWWDRWQQAYLHNLAPDTKMAGGALSYMGQYTQMFNYGDLLRHYVDPGQANPWLTLGWWAARTGGAPAAPSQQVDTLSASRWMSYNTVLGGPAQFYFRLAYGTWGNCDALLAIKHYLVWDTAAAAAPTAFPDPRPALPSTTFFDPAINRVVSRNRWATDATVFTYKASWMGINHQLADAGMFELYRRGEWLTNSMNGYATDASEIVGASSVLHNTLTIQNSCTNSSLDMPVNMQEDEKALWPLGSQLAEGFNSASDPKTNLSTWFGPSAGALQRYVASTTDMTGLYNRPSPWVPGNAAVDVLQAVRSVVWLDMDFIAVYDRATTGRPGKFKRFNLNTVQRPTLQPGTGPGTGRPAVLRAANASSGQALTLTSLLPDPGVANVTVTPSPTWTLVAEMEPTQWLVQVEDATRPTDVRYLHVLQATDAGVSAASASLVNGAVAGGAAGSYQGAAFDRYVVMFARHVRSPAAPVSAATYPLPPAPAPAVHVLTGLVPYASYALAVDVVAGTATLTQGSGGPGALLATADSAGVARFE